MKQRAGRYVAHLAANYLYRTIDQSTWMQERKDSVSSSRIPSAVISRIAVVKPEEAEPPDEAPAAGRLTGRPVLRSGLRQLA
jgi:hypothetical protein